MIHNLVWATGYNVITLPLAAGVLYNAGIMLRPAMGAVLMSVSTVVVSINARMLNLKRTNSNVPSTMDRFDFLKSFHPINNSDYELLTSKLRTKTFVKGEHLVTPGQIQKELYFIKTGVQSVTSKRIQKHMSLLLPIIQTSALFQDHFLHSLPQSTSSIPCPTVKWSV